MKKNLIIFIIITIIMIIISIIYNVFPRLQLNGPKNMTLSYRDTYKDPGVIVKNANGNYMSKIKIENNINNKILGTYYVDYSLNLSGKTLRVKRTVKIIDNIPPIIKLNGEQIITLSINEKYEEPGYVATDEYDGELTEFVKITGEVDTTKYGEYILTYEVKDKSDNTTKVNRIIKIIDEEKPTIECSEKYSAFKIENEFPVGCKAIDNYDGDITNKIKINGNYNTKESGIYKVTYTVEDEAKNKTSVEHNIIIYKPKNTKKAYLTFDDGPSQITIEILKILNQENIKATFFIADQQNQTNYKYLKNILEEGHLLGLHGYHYTDQLYQNKETFIKHFEQFQNTIKEQTNQEIKIYRFPGGSKSKYLSENTFIEIKKYLNNKDITYYDWDIDSKDSLNLNVTKEQIIENTINQIITNDKEEITILFHDTNTKEETKEALKTIIKLLKQMNYEFDTIDKSKPVQFR